jgi:hypothetical protein
MQKTEQTLVVRHATAGVNGKVDHGEMGNDLLTLKITLLG